MGSNPTLTANLESNMDQKTLRLLELAGVQPVVESEEVLMELGPKQTPAGTLKDVAKTMAQQVVNHARSVSKSDRQVPGRVKLLMDELHQQVNIIFPDADLD